MLAEYTIVDQFWSDMPEAKPRARARMKNGRPPATIVINDDGELEYDAQNTDIQIDTYQGAKYDAVRNEERRSAPISAYARSVQLPQPKRDPHADDAKIRPDKGVAP